MSTEYTPVKPLQVDTEKPIEGNECMIKSPNGQVEHGGEIAMSDMHDVKIHDKPIEEVVAMFKSDCEKGLTVEVANQRLIEYGLNELEKPPRVSLAMLFLVQLTSVIMYLLMAAVIASAVIKATGDKSDKFISYIDSIAITIIVLVNATIATVTENNANDALDALSSLQSPISNCIRGGEDVQVESKFLVVGDIVKLGTGDVVPADVRVFKANDLRVNEMLLTGEPEDVHKHAKVKVKAPGVAEKLTAENMAYSSCNVKAGSAVGIVTATGMKTRVGSIASLLNDTGVSVKAVDTEGNAIEGGTKKVEGCLPDTKSGQSPLQKNLEDLAVKIGYQAIAVCVIVFIVGVALDTKDPEDKDSKSWLFMILVAVTLTVAAIPEGLPLCVTIALSTGCSEMVDEHVLMRKIAAVETLGSASIICTDKTGTLTEGKMTLVAMWASGIDYVVTGKGFNPTVGEITVKDTGVDASQDGGVRATLGSAVLCSNTTLKLEKDEESGEEKWTPRGNSSEAPLIVAGHKVGIILEDMATRLGRVFEIPFSSSRKMMVTVTKSNVQPKLKHIANVGGHTAHVKGAPNYILEKCTKITRADGSIVPFTDEEKKKVLAKVDELSEQALRVLAVATRILDDSHTFDGDMDDTDIMFDKIVDDLTMCGLCASIDPDRDGVKDAVMASKTAGVSVVMITGDYLKTAIAIAKNINILNRETFTEDNGEATDCMALRPGKDGKYLSNEEFDNITKKTAVFARAKPEDKLEIVKSLQRQGWVCAMTGDGVNDAPALSKADIGVAMGLEGTEVAKGASDMILTDDNFCSIVKAIEKGRIIYAGIQKFVSFIMSVHLAEVLQIFLCIIFKVPVMRQPLQILFLILVTDLPPSIALGFEPGEALTMKRKPRPKTQPVVQPWMWRGIIANGLIITFCIFGTYMLALHAYAGAFLSDDITDPARTTCAIWHEDKFFAQVDFTCGEWSPCTDNLVYATPDLKYSATCAAFETTWAEVLKDPEQESFAAKAWLNVVNARGAIYTANDDCRKCITTSIRRARTAAFISLVWAENFRAYIARSFETPVWHNTFSNSSMNKAILMAQASLYIALFLPGLNEDVLGLYVYEIHGFGWFIAFIGAFSTLVFCELYKFLNQKFVEFEELAIPESEIEDVNDNTEDDKLVEKIDVQV
jgi:P-type Ca2+ transporter type 2C